MKKESIYLDYRKVAKEIKVPDNELKWADEWFSKKGLTQNSGKIVLVHPGASKLSKQKNMIKTWEPIKWTQLIDELLKKGVKVILAGGPDDEEDVNFIRKHIKDYGNNFIEAFGETKNMDQLAALIKKSDLLLCIDSAPMNVGVGVNTPLVAIFGPTNEKKLLPVDEKFTSVRVNLDCTPCLWDKRKTTCGELTCLKNLDVNTVLKTVLQKLGITSEIKC